MNDGPQPEVVKWYTRARKFPQLIGRTPDGKKLWGGPYTFTQAIGAGVVLFVGTRTMSLWASHGLLGNAALLLGAAYGTVLLLGKIPLGSRNPISVVTGAAHALWAPRTGRLAGRPVRPRRPHRVQHRVVMPLDPRAPRAVAGFAQPVPAANAPAAAARPAPAAQLALSGVQLLLARPARPSAEPH